jgi:WD40 repeat protein
MCELRGIAKMRMRFILLVGVAGFFGLSPVIDANGEGTTGPPAPDAPLQFALRRVPLLQPQREGLGGTISPGGKYVAFIARSPRYAIKIMSFPRCELISTVELRTIQVPALWFSPDERFLVLTDFNDDKAGQPCELTVYDIQKRSIITSCKPHGEDVRLVAFEDGGNSMLTVGGRVVRTWTFPDLKTIQHNQYFEGHIWSAGYHAKSHRLAVYCAGIDRVIVLDWRAKKRLLSVPGPRPDKDAWLPPPHPICRLYFSGDGEWLVGATSRSAHVWNAKTGRYTTAFKKHEFDIFHLIPLPNGRLVISASQDGKVYLWDCQTGKVAASLDYRTPDLMRQLNHIALTPNGKSLVVSLQNGEVQILDLIPK